MNADLFGDDPCGGRWVQLMNDDIAHIESQKSSTAKKATDPSQFWNERVPRTTV
jgi:hypothetical protein